MFAGGLAAGGATSAGRVAWEWSAVLSSSSEALNASAFASTLTSSVLVVRAGALAAGATYRFTLRATSVLPGGAAGEASLLITTNVGPTAGALSALPTSGDDGLTPFALSTSDWVEADRPLRYTFSARSLGEGARNETAQRLSSLTLANVLHDVILSGGGAAASSVAVEISVTAVDAFGASSALAATATVTLARPALLAGTSMAEYLLANGTAALEGAVASGNTAAAMQRITALSLLLSSEDTVAGKEASALALSRALTVALNRTAEVAARTSESVEQLSYSLGALAANMASVGGSDRDTLASLAASVSLQLVQTDALVTADSAANLGGALSSMMRVTAGVSTSSDARREETLAAGISSLGCALLRTAGRGEAPAVVDTPAFLLQSQVQDVERMGPLGPFGALNAAALANGTGGVSIVAVAYDAAIALHRAYGDSAVQRPASRRLSAIGSASIGALTRSATQPTTPIATMQVKQRRVGPQSDSAPQGRAPTVESSSEKPLVTMVLRTNVTAGEARLSRPHAHCDYWDTRLTTWAHRGVITLAARGHYMVCETAHLTDFGGSVRESATPELNTVHPIDDAHLLLKYDHTNATVPIIVGIFNLLFVVACITGGVVDHCSRKRAMKDRFGWRNRHNKRSAGASDFTHESEFDGDRVSVEECIPAWARRVECCGYSCHLWLLRRLGCGCDDSLCGLKRGGGVCCKSTRMIITEHSLLSIFLATPTFHPFTRSMRIGLLWVAYLTAFAVEALMWGKDDSRLEQKLRIAVVSALCMTPPIWLFTTLLKVRSVFASLTFTRAPCSVPRYLSRSIAHRCGLFGVLARSTSLTVALSLSLARSHPSSAPHRIVHDAFSADD